MHVINSLYACSPYSLPKLSLKKNYNILTVVLNQIPSSVSWSKSQCNQNLFLVESQSLAFAMAFFNNTLGYDRRRDSFYVWNSGSH